LRRGRRPGENIREEFDKNGERGSGTLSGKLLAPRLSRPTNRQTEPEICFRIVHLAQVDHTGAPVAAYRKQTVEIAIGPNGAFEIGNIPNRSSLQG
jgi:hypothetical protein